MQTIVFGLSNGAVYALMALAIGIVYSTTRIIHFAHDAVIMIGAMVSYWVIVVYGNSMIVGGLAGVITCALLNAVLYKGCVESLGDLSKNENWIITLFGAAILINNIARIIFGTEPQAYPYMFDGQRVSFLGANIMLHELMMILFAVVIGVTYELVCRKTRLGRAIRAVAYAPNTARLMGVNSKLIVMTCFCIAGFIAAVGGALIAPITFASYTMTLAIGLKGYAAALIGGLGDTKGAFIGGFALGLIECLITLILPAGIKDAISFLVMIIVIIFLPGGILSAKIFNRKQGSAEKV